jgi:hypothetical protein
MVIPKEKGTGDIRFAASMYKGEKFSHVHTMKAYRGNRGICPLILNLDTRWR